MLRIIGTGAANKGPAMRIMYSGNALIVRDTKFGYAATGNHPTKEPHSRCTVQHPHAGAVRVAMPGTLDSGLCRMDYRYAAWDTQVDEWVGGWFKMLVGNDCAVCDGAVAMNRVGASMTLCPLRPTGHR